MLYLPDPSDVEDIDIVVDDSQEDQGTEGEEDDSWFLWMMIAISVILAVLVIVLVVSRRGPDYDGIDDEVDNEEELDLWFISESKRETYKQLLEE